MKVCGSALALGTASALTLAAYLSNRDKGSAAISLGDLDALIARRRAAATAQAPAPAPAPTLARAPAPAPAPLRSARQEPAPAPPVSLGRKQGGIGGLASLNGVTVTFTGFRDKELGAELTSAGAFPSDNFTRATGLVVALDPHRKTGKVKQAHDKGIPVVSADELRAYLRRGGRAAGQRPQAKSSSSRRKDPEEMEVGETVWFDGPAGVTQVMYRGRIGDSATVMLDGFQMSVPFDKLSRERPLAGATKGLEPERQRRPRGADPIRGGVLLAKKLDGQDPIGMMASEKLDGVRAYWNGEGFYSRNGNRFAAPLWLTDLLLDEELDGELYMGPGKLYETISIVKTEEPTPAWRKLRYMVFDAPEAGGPFRERLERARQLVREACFRWKMPGPCPVQLVQHVPIRSAQDLDQFHREVTSRGVEGTMLRDPESLYERRRSGTLLKLKDFQDGLAEVVGYKEGATAKVGSYRMRDLENDALFAVDARHAPQGRRGGVLPVGTRVEYRFQERTPGGVPRHPILIGVRDYE